MMWRAADYRERARHTLQNQWSMAILVCLLGAILGAIATQNLVQLQYQTGDGWNLRLFELYDMNINTLMSDPIIRKTVTSATIIIGVWSIVRFFIGAVVKLGVCSYFIKLGSMGNAELADEFAYFKYFGKAVGLRIVVAVFTILWTLLFVIPGVMASYSYSLAPYILAENPEMGIMDAIAQSKRMMYQNRWKKFCLDLSFIGWSILSFMTLHIGDLFLNPYMQMASAHFYLNLKAVQTVNYE